MKTKTYPNTGLTLIVYSFIFFGWGLLTSFNGALIGNLNTILKLDEFANQLISYTFFGAYFLIGLIYFLISEKFDILNKIGYKNLTVSGLLIAALGALIFYPTFPFFMIGLVVLGLGIAVLQLAANTYIIEISSDGLGASRLNFVQALNSLGATVGPVVGGILILNTVKIDKNDIGALTMDQLQYLKFVHSQALQLPYLFLATVLFVLATLIFFLPMPDLKISNTVTTNNNYIGKNTWLATIGIVVYVGAEVTIGSNLGSLIDKHYPSLIPNKDFLITFYWASAMIGRFIGGFLLRITNSGFLLSFFAICAALLVLVGTCVSEEIGIYALALVGVFNSIMFPCIYANGIFELKEQKAKGGSLLIMAIGCSVFIPLLYTYMSDIIGSQPSFSIVAICYIFIAYYGNYFSKINVSK